MTMTKLPVATLRMTCRLLAAFHCVSGITVATLLMVSLPLSLPLSLSLFLSLSLSLSLSVCLSLSFSLSLSLILNISAAFKTPSNVAGSDFRGVVSQINGTKPGLIHLLDKVFNCTCQDWESNHPTKHTNFHPDSPGMAKYGLRGTYCR